MNIRASLHRFGYLFVIAFSCTTLVVPFSRAQQSGGLLTNNYIFTGGADGGDPQGVTPGPGAALTGNVYGTTQTGGDIHNPNCAPTIGCGTVFQLLLQPSTLTTLYKFTGGQDGAVPGAKIIIGPDGSFFGTTISGGGGPCSYSVYNGCGTIFRLLPPACLKSPCAWTEQVLHRFNGTDGSFPTSEVVFDAAGNFYGTASDGGTDNYYGVVYKMTRIGNTWTYSVIHEFNGNDGADPAGGLVLDSAGNLYGTSSGGGSVVFELSPDGHGGYKFSNLLGPNDTDGTLSTATLLMDASGNLFGTTRWGGLYDSGIVFELARNGNSWTYSKLTDFERFEDYCGIHCEGPGAPLIMDNAGNIYGTTVGGGDNGAGTIFELVKQGNGGYVRQDLYVFSQGEFGGAGGALGVFLDRKNELVGVLQWEWTNVGANAGEVYTYSLP